MNRLAYIAFGYGLCLLTMGIGNAISPAQATQPVDPEIAHMRALMASMPLDIVINATGTPPSRVTYVPRSKPDDIAMLIGELK